SYGILRSTLDRCIVAIVKWEGPKLGTFTHTNGLMSTDTAMNFSLRADAVFNTTSTAAAPVDVFSTLTLGIKSLPVLSVTTSANVPSSSTGYCFLCENLSTTTTAFAIVFAVIISTGVLGNLFVIGVILCDRKMLASPVNQLLLQLAIADLGNLIFCSPDAAMALIDKGWLLPNLACSIVRFLQEYSLYASVLF
ncbi:hypothetical protein OSTOST_11714, partial [Ostertagia ostertagi]